MLKKILPLNLYSVVLFSLIISGPNALAQVKGGQHTKLFDLFALEKFEDCAFKAESMVMSEKYKKDPEPLLYLSMCMYRISKLDSTQLDQHYKEPLKEALKYAKKFRSKDKDSSMFNANSQFFVDLKEAGIAQGNHLYNLGQFPKASAYFAMVNAFDESDHNVKLMKGVCDILGKNSSDGAKSIKEAFKGLEQRKDPSFKPDNISEPLLSDAMVIYSDYLNNNKLQDSAKKIITIAKDLLPGNAEVSSQYNLIHGIEGEERPAENSNKTDTKYEMHQPKDKSEIGSPDSSKVHEDEKIKSKELQPQSSPGNGEKLK